MAYMKAPKSASVSVIQNTGTDADTGKQLTASTSIPNIGNGPVADTVAAVVVKLTPLLEGTNARTEIREVFTLEAE